jgi:hypothetical protein
MVPSNRLVLCGKQFNERFLVGDKRLQFGNVPIGLGEVAGSSAMTIAFACRSVFFLPPGLTS